MKVGTWVIGLGALGGIFDKYSRSKRLAKPAVRLECKVYEEKGRPNKKYFNKSECVFGNYGVSKFPTVTAKLKVG